MTVNDLLKEKLRCLAEKTRGKTAFVLPKSVEYALDGQRFWDVPILLQKRCDELRAELEDTPADTNLSDDPRFMEYVLLQGPLHEWKQMDLEFITAGIEFALAR